MIEQVKLDVAIETLASKIALTMELLEKDPQLECELNNLYEERKKMYSGDKKIIEKIITVYGKELNAVFVKRGYNE